MVFATTAIPSPPTSYAPTQRDRPVPAVAAPCIRQELHRLRLLRGSWLRRAWPLCSTGCRGVVPLCHAANTVRKACCRPEQGDARARAAVSLAARAGAGMSLWPGRPGSNLNGPCTGTIARIEERLWNWRAVDTTICGVLCNYNNILLCYLRLLPAHSDLAQPLQIQSARGCTRLTTNLATGEKDHVDHHRHVYQGRRGCHGR